MGATPSVTMPPGNLFREYYKPSLRAIKESVEMYRELTKWKESLTALEFDMVFGHLFGDTEAHFRIFDGTRAGYGLCEPLEVFGALLAVAQAPLRHRCTIMFQLMTRTPDDYASEADYSIDSVDALARLIDSVTWGLNKLVLKITHNPGRSTALAESMFEAARRPTVTPSMFANWCEGNETVSAYLEQLESVVQKAKTSEVSLAQMYRASNLFSAAAVPYQQRLKDLVGEFPEEGWYTTVPNSALACSEWYKPPAYADASDTLLSAIQSMREAKLQAVPVFDKMFIFDKASRGPCGGIIDFLDIVRYFLNVHDKVAASSELSSLVTPLASSRPESKPVMTFASPSESTTHGEDSEFSGSDNEGDDFEEGPSIFSLSQDLSKVTSIVDSIAALQQTTRKLVTPARADSPTGLPTQLPPLQTLAESSSPAAGGPAETPGSRAGSRGRSRVQSFDSSLGLRSTTQALTTARALQRVADSKVKVLFGPTTSQRVFPLELGQVLFSSIHVMLTRYSHILLTVDHVVSTHDIYAVMTNKQMLRYIATRFSTICGKLAYLTVKESRIANHRPFTTIPFTCTAMEGFHMLTNKMERYGPIVDETGRVVGVLAVEDFANVIARTTGLDRLQPEILDDPVLNIAERENLPYCNQDTLLIDAVLTMVKFDTHFLVMVDQDFKPAGIFSVTDVIAYSLWATAHTANVRKELDTLANMHQVAEQLSGPAPPPESERGSPDSTTGPLPRSNNTSRRGGRRRPTSQIGIQLPPSQ